MKRVSYYEMKNILEKHYPDRVIFDDNCEIWVVANISTHMLVECFDFPEYDMTPEEFEKLVMMRKL